MALVIRSAVKTAPAPAIQKTERNEQRNIYMYMYMYTVQCVMSTFYTIISGGITSIDCDGLWYM